MSCDEFRVQSAAIRVLVFSRWTGGSPTDSVLLSRKSGRRRRVISCVVKCPLFDVRVRSWS